MSLLEQEVLRLLELASLLTELAARHSHVALHLLQPVEQLLQPPGLDIHLLLQGLVRLLQTQPGAFLLLQTLQDVPLPRLPGINARHRDRSTQQKPMVRVQEG